MVESTDHYEAWQKKKTEVQLLVMGEGLDNLVQKEHKEMWPYPVEIDLVPDIVLEVRSGGLQEEGREEECLSDRRC
jgi:hypothetical protein